jgi:hypothetical protein
MSSIETSSPSSSNKRRSVARKRSSQILRMRGDWDALLKMDLPSEIMALDGQIVKHGDQPKLGGSARADVWKGTWHGPFGNKAVCAWIQYAAIYQRSDMVYLKVALKEYRQLRVSDNVKKVRITTSTPQLRLAHFNSS